MARRIHWLDDFGVRMLGSGISPVPGAEAKSPDADGSSGHVAALYHDASEYVRFVRAFAVDGEAAGDPLFVAVGGGSMQQVRQVLDGRRGPAAFHDVTELGRNPARIIPAAQSFAGQHSGRRVRCIWEPAWPQRSAAEFCAVTRHEAVANLALDPAMVSVLCPYDAAALPSRVISEARCTHPEVLDSGRRQASPDYLGPACVPPGCLRPLVPPPAHAERLVYDTKLRPVRALVAAEATRAGLSAGQRSDLVLAVGELAANTLRHTGAAGTLHAWHTAREVLCQVHDNGTIADPLAGFRREPPDAAGGHGLWLVNQLCDLVELRTGQQGEGTTIRVHMLRRSGKQNPVPRLS
jgi:anti-sigma regulatory factor (Ser/Thr protein kinase)